MPVAVMEILKLIQYSLKQTKLKLVIKYGASIKNTRWRNG